MKVLKGTDQPCRMQGNAAVELPLVDSIPEPPTWLPNDHAIAEWNRLAPILYANKLLTVAGLSAFGQLCALHGLVVAAYEKKGEEPPKASTLATLRGMMNDFGLTPVAQGKVRSSGEAEKQQNRFISNRRK